MTTRGLPPEIGKRLRELVGPSASPANRSIDEAIATFIASGNHDEWTVRTARRIYAEDAEFFEMLGDR